MAERKIIFVNRVHWPDESATAQLLSDLAPALVQRGWAVHVITGGGGPVEGAGVTIHRTGGDNSVQTIPARVRSYGNFLHRARRLIGRLAGPGDVVVLKTDPPLLGAVATGVARAKGAHVCQWIQDIYPEIVVAHKGPGLTPLVSPLRALRDRAWRQSARCVVVSTDMAATVARAGVARVSIRVLPNWAPRELDQPATTAEIEAVRRGWNLAGKFVVAYSGNLGRVHEFDTLIAAAAEMRADPAIAFVFIGNGPRLQHVRRAVADRGLGNVHFLPPSPRTALTASLAAADVHLVTLREGFESLVFPSKLAGILASRRPAVFVGAVRSGLADFIQQEQCGEVVACGQGCRLAEVLRDLHQHPGRTARLGEAARAAYERRFQFRAAVNSWDHLLRELIDQESRLPCA